MTMKLSSVAKAYMALGGSMLSAFNNGILNVYSGTRPSAATPGIPSGSTLLLSVTPAAAPFTAGVAGIGQLTITSVTAGAQFTAVSVGGKAVGNAGKPFSAVPATSDTTSTATALAAAINAANTDASFYASASGNVITFNESRGYFGSHAADAILVTAGSGITVSASPFTTGAQPSGGLVWTSDSNPGELIKPSGTVWQGANFSGGDASWFRLFGALGAADTIFADGDVGITSAADLQLLPIVTLSAGATTTLNSAQFNIAP